MSRHSLRSVLPLLALAAVAAPLVSAHAEALSGIAAPAGDTGLWATVNTYLNPLLGTAVTGAIGWAVVRFHQATGVTITATQEERVRQTLLTGLYQAAHGLEVKLDGTVTPTQRQQVLSGMVTWAMKRMPGPAGVLARLGIGQTVLMGMATKMLGQVLAGRPASALGGSAAVEDPAMDRAAGPASASGLMARAGATPRA